MTKKNASVSVNLGCGTHIVREPGWINVDNFVLNDDKSFLQADIRDLPLECNTVDYLLCDQVLEHMAMADVPVVLFHIRRVLKKGGRAVIMVPDFESAAKQWIDAHLNLAFDPLQYRWFSEPIYGNQASEGEFHRTPMSPSYLHYMLNMVGLTQHEITYASAFSDVPQYPGMRPVVQNAKLRNAQLIADIIKV